MSDQEPPAFTVVDRRSTASSDLPDDSVTTENTTAQTPAAPDDSQSEADEELADESGFEMPDPAAIFSFVGMQMDTRSLSVALLAIYDTHAWRAMGLLSDPATGATHKDLPAAQLAIDVVQFLLGKVESDLTADERRDAHRRLNDLRMNFLAKSRE